MQNISDTVTLSSVDAVLEQAWAMQASIKAHGYCIVKGLPNTAESVLRLGQHMGNIQGHVRADANGVVGGGPPVDTSWKSQRKEFEDVGSEDEFFAHTDGSYLNGLYVDESGMANPIVPPRLLLLQIAQQAGKGGENFIVDGKKILQYLLEHEPQTAKMLFHPHCITISRDDVIAARVPVFEKANDGRIKIRFRFDNKVYAPEWSLPAVRRFHELANDPRFKKELKAETDDIIVIDNLAALHGRNAFENGESYERKFRRVYINDDDVQAVFNVAADAHCNRSQAPYAAYISRPSPVPPEQRLPIDCGIKGVALSL